MVQLRCLHAADEAQQDLPLPGVPAGQVLLHRMPDLPLDESAQHRVPSWQLTAPHRGSAAELSAFA